MRNVLVNLLAARKSSMRLPAQAVVNSFCADSFVSLSKSREDRTKGETVGEARSRRSGRGRQGEDQLTLPGLRSKAKIRKSLASSPELKLLILNSATSPSKSIALSWIAVRTVQPLMALLQSRHCGPRRPIPPYRREIARDPFQCEICIFFPFSEYPVLELFSVHVRELERAICCGLAGL